MHSDEKGQGGGPRTWIVGSSSFIAENYLSQYSAVSVSGRTLSGLYPEEDDTVINCALNPEFKSNAYLEANDMDSQIADRIASSRARYIMLSTRMVYGVGDYRGVCEDDIKNPANFYGENKLRAESNVLTMLGPRATILRLSNVIGFEWPANGRRSFMSMVLGRLRSEGEIFFDMKPGSLRDFIPVEFVCEVIHAIVSRQESSFAYRQLNVGSGFPCACSDIASSVIAGYGSGRLRVEDSGKVDEFFLCTKRLFEELGISCSRPSLLRYCESLGKKLSYA